MRYISKTNRKAKPKTKTNGLLDMLRNKKMENFEGATATTTTPPPQKEEEKSNTGTSILVFISVIVIWIVGGVFAAMFSWKCNTATGMNILVKILFAIIAFIFSIFYLLWYAVYQMTGCTLLKRMPRRLNENVMVPGTVRPAIPPAPVGPMTAPAATVGGRRK